MSMGGGMRLFMAPESPHARIVRMAVLEKALDIPFEPAAPPNATLVTEDGSVLRDTTPILLHLDTVAPSPPLLRLDGADAWRGIAAYSQAIGLIEAIAAWRRARRHSADEAAIAAASVRAAVLADALEEAVASGGYEGGPTGFPDAAWIALAAALGYGAGDLRFDWATGRPALAAWFDAAAQRPSFSETPPGA